MILRLPNYWSYHRYFYFDTCCQGHKFISRGDLIVAGFTVLKGWLARKIQKREFLTRLQYHVPWDILIHFHSHTKRTDLSAVADVRRLFCSAGTSPWGSLISPRLFASRARDTKKMTCCYDNRNSNTKNHTQTTLINHLTSRPHLYHTHAAHTDRTLMGVARFRDLCSEPLTKSCSVELLTNLYL